jgi:hypothetical protein
LYLHPANLNQPEDLSQLVFQHPREEFAKNPSRGKEELPDLVMDAKSTRFRLTFCME